MDNQLKKTLERLGIPNLHRKQLYQEVAGRIKSSRLWCQRHWTLLTDPNLNCSSKFQIYKFFVRPILAYGSELWKLDKRTSDKLLRFECSILLEIYKSKYRYRHPKRLRPKLKEVYSRFRERDIVDYIKNERLCWNELITNEQRALLREEGQYNEKVHWWDDSTTE